MPFLAERPAIHGTERAAVAVEHVREAEALIKEARRRRRRRWIRGTVAVLLVAAGATTWVLLDGRPAPRAQRASPPPGRPRRARVPRPSSTARSRHGRARGSVRRARHAVRARRPRRHRRRALGTARPARHARAAGPQQQDPLGLEASGYSRVHPPDHGAAADRRHRGRARPTADRRRRTRTVHHRHAGRRMLAVHAPLVRAYRHGRLAVRGRVVPSAGAPKAG